MKKRTWIILGVVIAGVLLMDYLISVVISPFLVSVFSPMQQPANRAAAVYIFDNEEFEKTYGEVESVGLVKDVSILETKTSVKRQYKVFTTDWVVIVQISSEKKSGEWAVIKMETIDANERLPGEEGS